MDPEKPLFIIATGCSCPDIISSFFLKTKPKIMGHILGYDAHICYYLFLQPLICMHTYTRFLDAKKRSKTMDLFMLSRADNKISITQIPQGFRWQEALFIVEDIWVQGTYSAHVEVQWEQEITFLCSLCFATQRAEKWSKYQALCESELVICLALLAEIQG